MLEGKSFYTIFKNWDVEVDEQAEGDVLRKIKVEYTIIIKTQSYVLDW